MTLCWGVQSYVTPEYTNTDAMVKSVQDALAATGFMATGDRVVVVSGNPGRHMHKTNALRIYEMD